MVVVGAGVTGALIANELAANGLDVVVVDPRDVAWGSTSASTALLQYEIDTHAIDLARCYGEAQALLVYQSCLNAIVRLAEVAHAVGDVDFAFCDSLYYAKLPNRSQGFELAGAHAALGVRAAVSVPADYRRRQAAGGWRGRQCGSA